VSLIDAPTDPLGTLAVVCGIYEGKVARSKYEVTHQQRRDAYDAMMATVLSGPLEAVQFTFLIEGVSRAITHQMVRNRFSFFAQESLRFAVAEDWAQEIPLPPSLAGRATDDPLVMVWRRSLNGAEDAYAALVAAGMPAEEARGVLPHAITTRLYWTVSLRTLLTEAGKRTCTQAQFDWRVLFGGIAKVFREHARSLPRLEAPMLDDPDRLVGVSDAWQYELFASALRPVCYQTGSCGFMAKFDRGCTIRSRVDANERVGRPSSDWHLPWLGEWKGDGTGAHGEDIAAIDPAEWAADPSAARVTEEE
jgi:thymidylate synthase (FAD)